MNDNDYDLKTPYTEQEDDLRGDPSLMAGRATVPQGQQVGRVQQVHLHGAAKVEGVKGNQADIVPSAPLAAGRNAGEHNPQHHKTGSDDAGPHVPDKTKTAPEGISVSTVPTYKDDMKKEGY